MIKQIINNYLLKKKNNLPPKEDNLPVKQKTKKSSPMSYVLLFLALVYDIMPVDLIPDVPIVGWVDDIFITFIAFLNLIEKKFVQQQTAIQYILRAIKWLLILVGFIIIIIMMLIFYGILKLIF